MTVVVRLRPCLCDILIFLIDAHFHARAMILILRYFSCKEGASAAKETGADDPFQMSLLMLIHWS